jgi:hypothetical protein
MSDFTGLYDVRDFSDSDRNFVTATFLRGLYYGDSWFSLIPKSIFMESYQQVIKALLASPNVAVRVACLKEDPSVILGYCVLSKNQGTVHWVFVKAAWRKQGIGRSLLPESPLYFSHLSMLGKSLMSKYPKTVFNPFSL